MTDMLALTALEGKARAALPTDEADWGSERQIAAENAFFSDVKVVLTAEDYADLEQWCIKATTEEMVLEALRRVKLAWSLT